MTKPRPRSRSRRAPGADAGDVTRTTVGARASASAPADEEIEILTGDGVSLRAVAMEPAAPPFATVILAHAMFARKSEFLRPPSTCLAAFFRGRGYRAIAFDFRGHGDSGGVTTREGWRYDDLVVHDLPAVVSSARARGEGRVFVVGHSLGGHVALASQGTGHLDADAIVAVAANVWLTSLEPSPVLRALKRGISSAGARLVSRVGFFPARGLRLGSDDEAGEYMQAIFAPARMGAWRSASGDDYLAALANVQIPVYALTSEGDRLNCTPASGEALARRCGGPVHLERVVSRDDGSPPPSHMGLVTDPRTRLPWTRVDAWLRALP